MLSQLRKYVGYVISAVMFFLLIVSMAVFGNMFDAFKPQANNLVARAGSHQVDAPGFKARLESIIARQNQQNQQNPQTAGQPPITLADAVAQGAVPNILQGMSQELSVFELISRIGVRPGAKLVTNELGKEPAFFDPLTGKFDRKAYATVLRDNGLTPQAYEQSLADDIALAQFNAAANAGLHAPKAYGAFFAEYGRAGRSVSYFAIDASKVGPSPAPTDAQLMAYLNEFGQKNPEARALSIVRFSAAALAPTMPVDPAEVQKQFNFYKASNSTPETRSVVVVKAKDDAQAAAIAARIGKGEDPQAVAKSLGAQVLTYDNKPKTAIPDAKVAEAAFSLPLNQVSGVVKGDLGDAVIRVTAITPGKEANFEEMRPQLEQAVRQQAAEEKVSDLADKFDTAQQSGSDMAKAAAAVGATVITTEPVVQQGVTLQGAPVKGLSQKLLIEAFKLAQGSTSEILSDGRGEYFVVRVDKIVPSAFPPMDKIRADLDKAWRQHDLDARLKAKADELAARVRKGETIEAVAASIGATVTHAEDVNRMEAQKVAATLGQGLLTDLFAGKKGDVLSAPGPGQTDPKVPVALTYMVARLDNVSPAPVEAGLPVVQQGIDQYNQLMGQELTQSFLMVAPGMVKLKTYPDRALTSVGGTPPAPKGKTG